jgi:inhibitor of cysteine peptidase
MTDFTLTTEDNGKNICISIGDLITIKIPENPVDGYKWEVDQYDEKMLQSIGSTFSQLINCESSKAGIRSVSFTAQSAGLSQIDLKHWRNWEGQASVNNQFKITVSISD